MPKRTVAAALLLTGLSATTAAWATPVNDAASAIAAGNPQTALATLNQWLGAHPDDDRAKFLRATALADTGALGEAIAVLKNLAQAYPHRADVWNNLGILEARDGQLDDARVSLLRAAAIAPDQAAIERNLGDVYLALAAAAYHQAGSDARSRTRELKTLLPALTGLDLSKHSTAGASVSADSSHTSASRSKTAGARSTSGDSVPSAASVSASSAGQSITSPSASAPDKSSIPTVDAPDVGNVSSSSTSGGDSDATASSKAEAALPNGTRQAVTTVLDTRAAARNKGNLSGWLAAYSDNFEPAGGVTRSQWIERQHSLLSQPLATPIHVENVKVSPTASGHVNATWDQVTGQSGQRVAERATFVRQDGDWRILALK